MLSGRGGTTGPGAGARRAVGDRRAVDPVAAGASAGRGHPVPRGPGGVHRDRLGADHWLRLAAPAGGVRRVPGHRAPLRGLDRGRAVAAGCIGRCSTGSVSRRRSTGRARWSTRPASARKKGPADRAEPRRPRQARLQAARAHRYRRPAAGGGGQRGQHPRQPRAHPTGAGHPRHPLPPRTAPAPTGQAARRQGLGLRAPAGLASLSPHRPTDRLPRGRIQRAAGSAPLGR